MIENAAELGPYFENSLRQALGDRVAEVRGRGLMIAVQLHADAGGARPYCEALKERGLLCKETHVDTIRLAPPLVITREEIDWAVEQVAAVL